MAHSILYVNTHYPAGYTVWGVSPHWDCITTCVTWCSRLEIYVRTRCADWITCFGGNVFVRSIGECFSRGFANETSGVFAAPKHHRRFWQIHIKLNAMTWSYEGWIKRPKYNSWKYASEMDWKSFYFKGTGMSLLWVHWKKNRSKPVLCSHLRSK